MTCKNEAIAGPLACRACESGRDRDIRRKRCITCTHWSRDKDSCWWDGICALTGKPVNSKTRCSLDVKPDGIENILFLEGEYVSRLLDALELAEAELTALKKHVTEAGNWDLINALAEIEALKNQIEGDEA